MSFLSGHADGRAGSDKHHGSPALMERYGAHGRAGAESCHRPSGLSRLGRAPLRHSGAHARPAGPRPADPPWPAAAVGAVGNTKARLGVQNRWLRPREGSRGKAILGPVGRCDSGCRADDRSLAGGPMRPPLPWPPPCRGPRANHQSAQGIVTTSRSWPGVPLLGGPSPDLVLQRRGAG